jgi:hypothetical protein
MSNVKKTIEKFFKSSTKNDKCVNRHRRWNEKFSMYFFQIFFHEIFLSLILTRHRKNKKKISNFSIYLKNYLLLRDKTKRRLFDENEDLHLKLLVCSDLLDEDIIFFLFSFFFLFFAFYFHFFFFLLFSKEFELSSFFEQIRLERRRASSSWRKSENRSWCRSENIWKNESKHHKHFHRCFVSLIVQKRRFIKLIFVDKRSN